MRDGCTFYNCHIIKKGSPNGLTGHSYFFPAFLGQTMPIPSSNRPHNIEWLDRQFPPPDHFEFFLPEPYRAVAVPT